jgi:energy-coupling factor transporter ATP-binding protein EcfA2
VADGARLRERGVTIILTTHYIEEAEEMADRIGVINRGELLLVEDKHALMRKLGKKQLTSPAGPAAGAAGGRWPTCRWSWPPTASSWSTPSTSQEGERTGIAALLRRLQDAGIDFKDLHTSESSLEEIFVSLVQGAAMNLARDPRDLPLRDGAHLPHHGREPRLAGADHLAVLHRVRRGDRLAHGRDRRRGATAPSSSPA